VLPRSRPKIVTGLLFTLILCHILLSPKPYCDEKKIEPSGILYCTQSIMFPSIRARKQHKHHQSSSGSVASSLSSSSSRRRMTIEDATRLRSATAMMMMPAGAMSYMHTTVVGRDDLPGHLDEAATMEPSSSSSVVTPWKTGRNPFRRYSCQPHQRYHRHHRKVQWQSDSPMLKERGTFA
jgi:hypothetical protein